MTENTIDVKIHIISTPLTNTTIAVKFQYVLQREKTTTLSKGCSCLFSNFILFPVRLYCLMINPHIGELFLLYVNDRVSSSLLWPHSYYVAKDYFQFLIFLRYKPRWYYVLPCLVLCGLEDETQGTGHVRQTL